MVMWFKAATRPPPDLYEIALTTIRNRCGLIPAIAPLYLAQAREIARQIASTAPRLQDERAVADYLESEILRAEFSLIEDVLDGSLDLVAFPVDRVWWCKTHHRVATDVRGPGRHPVGTHCCDPKLGGILLPCDAQEMTEAEVAEFERKAREPRAPDYVARHGLLVPSA